MTDGQGPPTSPSQPAIPPDPKAGVFTTEFWATVVTLLLPVLALIFHRDLSGQVQAIAAAAAGVAIAVYSLSRALTKSAQLKASAMQAAQPTVQPRSAPQQDGDGLAVITPADAGSGAEVQAAVQQLVRLLDAEASKASRSTPVGAGSAAATPTIVLIPGASHSRTFREAGSP
jgi:hypothetical protein